MYAIHIEKHIVSGIPVLVFAKPNIERRPLVFCNHGFTNAKESLLEYGYRSAEAGQVCVLPDAYLHGERIGPPISRLDDPERHFLYPQGTGFDNYLAMIDCALHTARDLEILIDHFAEDQRVDIQRVGAAGYSMGGFAAYFAASASKRITAAAPAGAYPEIARRWHDAVLEASAYEEWAAAMEALHDEALRRGTWLRQIEPSSQMLVSYRKPLFIQCGDLDLDAHKSYSVPFFGAMRPLYHARSESLRLKIYDNVAHTLTSEMIRDSIEFFQKCL